MSAGRGVDRVDFVLSGTGRACEVALAWLHGLLVRVAARKLRRRQVPAASTGGAGRERGQIAGGA
jgi:hypothetical protein